VVAGGVEGYDSGLLVMLGYCVDQISRRFQYCGKKIKAYFVRG